jgi:hypothetical protein
MRAHVNQFDITNDMIVNCWCHFRQNNKSIIQKYGASVKDPIVLDENSKILYDQNFESLFQLFIDLDSPERENEYYAIHFIYETGYELHISRIPAQMLKSDPERFQNNIRVLIVPSDVNYERGPILSKILRNQTTLQHPMNLDTNKILFITIHGTPHDTDYQLWNIDKRNQLAPGTQTQSNPDTIMFLILGQSQR